MRKLLDELIEKVDNKKLYQKRKITENLVESFFEKKQTFDEFLEENVSSIFEEHYNIWKQNQLHEEIAPGGEKVIRFPKIKITENWGKVDNEDRELLETLMANIQGGTVEEKVQSVSDFIGYKPDLNIPTIMSHLMFLEIFSSIIEEFNAATAGFLFEAFLAGIFQGTQVDDPEQVGATPGSLPIEDVRLAIRSKDEASEKIIPYSLKVLSPGTELKGSFVNLVDYFADLSPERYNEAIVYLVVTKKGQGTLSFHEFTIRPENWLDYIGHKWYKEIPIQKVFSFDGQELIDYLGLKPQLIGKGNNKKEKYILTKKNIADPSSEIVDFIAKSTNVKGADIKVLNVNIEGQPSKDRDPSERLVLNAPGNFVVYPEEVYNVQYVDAERSLEASDEKLTANAKRLYGSAENIDKLKKIADRGDFASFWKAMRQTRGYQNNEQFHIAPKYYRHPSLSQHLGDIDLYKPRLVELANKYAKDLTAELINIYNALDALSMNVNKYFLSTDGNSKQYGKQAVKDSKILYDNTKKAVGITGG